MHLLLPGKRLASLYRLKNLGQANCFPTLAGPALSLFFRLCHLTLLLL